MKTNSSKKILLVFSVIIFSIVFILGIFMVTRAAISGKKYLSIAVLRERNNKIMGYRLKENSRVIWKIQERASEDTTIPPIKNQPAIYCLKGGLGFRESGTIYTYDISYNMLTEKEKIAEQNDVLKGLVNSGKWNKIIALLANTYMPGESGEEYRKVLLDKVQEKYPGEYEHLITDTDIEVTNQAVLWSLTNSDEEMYNNYEKTDWLEYTTDATEYYALSKYNEETGEGKERQEQIESLYKYLLDSSERYFLGGEIVNQVCEVTSKNGCNVKKEPGTSAETIIKLEKGTRMTKIRDNVGFVEGRTWSLVRLEDGTEGYVNSNLYKIVEYNEKCQVNTNSGVRLRETPSTSAQIVGSAANGTIITRIERNVATANGFEWDKVQIEDGTIGYAASKYLKLLPNELYEENFQGIEKPITVNSENELTCEIKDTNYIVGPIKFTKNNDLLYSVDFDVKIGDTKVENYAVLNNEKVEINKKDIGAGEYYLSIPIIGIKTISVNVKVNYESTELTLWASEENPKAQPVVYVSKENKTDEVSLNVNSGVQVNIPEHKITKTGTESISSREDKVQYDINYNTSVDNYVGNIKVKIEDTLPYEIDEANSDLGDGKYNKENRTITWEIDYENVNTFTNENKKFDISVNKTVNLLFKDIDVTAEKFTNNVTGTLTLDEKELLVDKATCDTLVNVKGRLDVFYKDKYSKEDIDPKVSYTEKVGTDFDVSKDEKEFEDYTLVEPPKVKTGKFSEEVQEKTYWYAKNTEVIVRYLELDDTPLDSTDNKILSDEKTFLGYQGKPYTTEQKEIEGYKFVENTGNTSGNMAEDTIIVVYYYVPNTEVPENKVEKTSTGSYTSRTDKIRYDIKYNAKINYYVGNATLSLVDKLPYPINEEESELDEGIYNEEAQTITWNINLENINTFSNGKNITHNVEVRKTILLLYKDVDVTKDSMTNIIDSKLILEETETVLESKDTADVDILVKGKVDVLYKDRNTQEELSNKVTKEGKVGTEFDVTEDRKDFKNYTLVEEPSPKDGTFKEEAQEKVYWYAKNTKVIVNHIDKISEKKLAVVEDDGLVGDEYTSTAKDFDNYVLSDKPEKETVILTEDVIVLNYYYIYISTGVVEKHIDIMTGALLDDAQYEGYEGDEYFTKEKEFEGYDIVTNEKYYNEYVKQNPDFLKENKVNDVKELLIKLEKNATDPYIPDNSTGKMAKELIEVKYYYAKKSSVRVEYLDKITGNLLKEKDSTTQEEKDSTEYLYGHEGDKYSTKEKEFENYVIVKEMYPENATGEMEEKEVVVKYYYVYKTQVIEKHIDIVTEKLLEEETKYDGFEQDTYNTNSKEFEGYDIVTNERYYEKYVKDNPDLLKDNKVDNVEDYILKQGKNPTDPYIPDNSSGTMTKEVIEVKYYYVKKSSVRVEYIDKITGKLLTEEDSKTKEEKDSTEYLYGHEGDKYSTKEKKFENYVIVEEMYPENATGEMEAEEIVVKYYYVHVSSGVVEKHIDIKSGKLLEEETRYSGNEGDAYKTVPKEFENYKLVEEKYPKNAEGTMTKEEIEVDYYYIKQVKLTVRHLEDGTDKKLANEENRVLSEGDEYSTNSKDIKGYSLVNSKIPDNKEGVIGDKDIVITYYYSAIKENSQAPAQPAPPQPQTVVVLPAASSVENDSSNVKPKVDPDSTKYLPMTGDTLPIIAIAVIVVIAIINVIQIIISKRKKNKEE